MKKIFIVQLLSLALFAGTINLHFANEQLSSGNWNLTYAKDKTSMLLLPMDVNFTDIQKSLDSDGFLYVYTNEQTRSLLEAKFGVSFVGLVKITKTDIKYAVIDDAGTHVYNSFSGLSDYLKHSIEPNIESSTISIFENSYIPYLEKIKANGLYKIMPEVENFTFNVSLPIDSLSQDTNGSGSLLPPPSPHLQ